MSSEVIAIRFHFRVDIVTIKARSNGWQLEAGENLRTLKCIFSDISSVLAMLICLL